MLLCSVNILPIPTATCFSEIVLPDNKEKEEMVPACPLQKRMKAWIDQADVVFHKVKVEKQDLMDRIEVLSKEKEEIKAELLKVSEPLGRI